MKLTDILNEIKINQPNSKRPPALLEVIKDIYVVGIDALNDETYYTKEEIDSAIFHKFVVGDIWKLKKDEDEDIGYYYECIKGIFEGEDSDEVAWEYNDETKDFFKILKR